MPGAQELLVVRFARVDFEPCVIPTMNMFVSQVVLVLQDQPFRKRIDLQIDYRIRNCFSKMGQFLNCYAFHKYMLIQLFTKFQDYMD